MSGSFYNRQPKSLLNNSVILQAYLYTHDTQSLVAQGDISEVTFTVLKPTDDISTPSLVDEPGTIVADGTGQYVVTAATNDVSGEYKAYATFVYDDQGESNLTKSVPCDYEIVDPFERAGAGPADGAVDQCWMKIEDCFDSEFGGPWLRDMTMAVFDKSKVKGLLPEAFLEINQETPFTDFNAENFPYAVHDGEALLAEALLISTIRHLIRSYTEQPDTVSSPVAFLDRKRYQEAWINVYNLELQRFQRWLTWWKRRSYDLSHASMLISNKAGRSLAAPMRSRNVGRGFGY